MHSLLKQPQNAGFLKQQQYLYLLVLSVVVVLLQMWIGKSVHIRYTMKLPYINKGGEGVLISEVSLFQWLKHE